MCNVFKCVNLESFQHSCAFGRFWEANIKQSSWLLAIEHASKVLLIEKELS